MYFDIFEAADVNHAFLVCRKDGGEDYEVLFATSKRARHEHGAGGSDDIGDGVFEEKWVFRGRDSIEESKSASFGGVIAGSHWHENFTSRRGSEGGHPK